MWDIPLFDREFDLKEQEIITQILERKWLSTGPYTKKFEDVFTKYVGGGVESTAVSSCTAALHLALLASDISPGDEVIISGLSFVAALNIVSLVGAIPVIADSKSLDDWNVSCEDIEIKITPKTKAIIIVHFAGYPCDLDKITNLSQKYNLLLIEDVAHAIGAEYKNKKCGTFGDIACFSFFSNKNLSTGEGGMFVSKNKEFSSKAKLLRSHGMTSMTIDRHRGKIQSYDVLMPGLNYRFDELRAGLGLVQLSKLDENNNKRERLVRLYNNTLSTNPNIMIPFLELSKEKKSSYHIYPILLSREVNRDAFREHLASNGIQTSQHYPAYEDFSFYKNKIPRKTPIAREISNRVVTLPLYPHLKEAKVIYITKIINNYL